MWIDDIANRRPISRNFNHGGMIRPLRGLVLHIQGGHEDGTFGTFNTAGSRRSAHFGNPKQGRLEQFVDTDDMAWAQVAGNPFWISVENEGFGGDSLTPSQLDNVATLLGWLHWNEQVPLKIAETPNDYGLGYHAMGKAAWGATGCPGKSILIQRPLILERAGFWRPEPTSIDI
jgi:N-acetylmuramoyl-L-alanine amidase-like protein